ncbi:Exoenzyme S synthesis regulatory protein ExsA [compost metagenome]
MEKSFHIFSSYEYKLQFLPGIKTQILNNRSLLQLYRLESYLKTIIIPVLPYRTSFNFMLFVTSGHIKQQLESDHYMIKPGQVLHIRQGSITRTIELSEDLQGFYLIYENEIITDISLNRQDINFLSSDPFVTLPDQVYQWLTKAFELLEEELQTDAIREEICNTFFRAVLLKIITLAPQNPLIIARELEIAHKFREQLQAHHKQHRDVLFYARELNISETYMNKCIKRATGKPPKQWITEVCIQHSQILMRDLGREIAEVADSLNFQSPSHFSRMFKKVVGVSPSAFRAAFKKPPAS